MSDISLITSLYRSEAYLPDFLEHLVDLRGELGAHGIDAEFVLIANDASSEEVDLLDPLERDRIIQVAYVGRESLYSSWNRGVQMAHSHVLGFWNVDDVRTSDAIVEALDRFAQGYDLVDTPLNVYEDDELVETRPPMFDPRFISPKHVVGTFFMFTRDLYDEAGAFDGHFRISGDLEWSTRPEVRQCRHTATQAIGGDFVIHDNNLSQSTNEREWVEINTVLIWRGAYDQLRPVSPTIMRDLWEHWGHEAGELPETIAEWLWGEEAQERYEAHTRWRSSHPLWQKARLWSALRLGAAHPEDPFRPPAL